MANKDTKTNLVDISSNTQVFKLYNKKGRARRIVCLVLSILFLLGGAGTLYYYSLLDSVNYVADDDADKKTRKTPADGNSDNVIADSELLEDSKVLNVMLFGEDNNHGEKYGRTDTMILLSVDNTHKKL
jgi:anionic cell wall polymer biosynthesis LytR-Cps2A-Psr (LCP) family protein